MASNGVPTPALTESGALPSGVTFQDNGNGTATLSGTPSAGSNGTYPLTITANNGVSPNANQSFTLKVTQAPAITSGSSTTFTAGTSDSFTVTTNGTRPTRSRRRARCRAVCPSSTTATARARCPAIRRPTGGVYPITFGASNGVGSPASQSFTLTVNGRRRSPRPAATDFAEAVSSNFTVTTTGYPTAALTETGPLPTGVTFIDNGNGTASLSGTPGPRHGGLLPDHHHRLQRHRLDATQSFTLTWPGPPSPRPSPPPPRTTFQEGAPASFTVTTSG